MNWTPGRLKGFITSTIRAGFRKYPPKYEALKDAIVGKKENKATGRIATFYKCAKCKKEFLQKDVEVDHINPVVCPKEGFTTWDNFVNRLFCSKENLQVLCVNCHNAKTAKERKERVK